MKNNWNKNKIILLLLAFTSDEIHNILHIIVKKYWNGWLPPPARRLWRDKMLPPFFFFFFLIGRGLRTPVKWMSKAIVLLYLHKIYFAWNKNNQLNNAVCFFHACVVLCFLCFRWCADVRQFSTPCIII